MFRLCWISPTSKLERFAGTWFFFTSRPISVQFDEISVKFYEIKNLLNGWNEWRGFVREICGIFFFSSPPESCFYICWYFETLEKIPSWRDLQNLDFCCFSSALLQSPISDRTTLIHPHCGFNTHPSFLLIMIMIMIVMRRMTKVLMRKFLKNICLWLRREISIFFFATFSKKVSVG